MGGGGWLFLLACSQAPRGMPAPSPPLPPTEGAEICCLSPHLSISVHHKMSSFSFMKTGKCWSFPCLMELERVVIVRTLLNCRGRQGQELSDGSGLPLSPESSLEHTY